MDTRWANRVLVELARVLGTQTPVGGQVGRYGGEEFAIVLPKTDQPATVRLAENARKSIESTTVDSDEGKLLRITASIGVATHDGRLFNNVEQLIKAADQSVYAAKAAGRNCVRIFAPKSKTKRKVA